MRDKRGGVAVVVAGRGLAVDVEPPTLKTLLAGIKSVGLSEGARCWDLRESGGALCVQRVWQHSAPLVTFGRIAALSKRESLVASREQLGVLLARGQQPAAPRGIGRLIGTSIRRRLLVHVEGAELNTKRLCQPENELVRTANVHAAQFSAWKTTLVRAGVGPSTTHSRREQATAYAIGSLNQHHVTWPERTGGSQPIPRISSGDAAAHNHNRLPLFGCGRGGQRRRHFDDGSLARFRGPGGGRGAPCTSCQEERAAHDATHERNGRPEQLPTPRGSEERLVTTSEHLCRRCLKRVTTSEHLC